MQLRYNDVAAEPRCGFDSACAGRTRETGGVRFHGTNTNAQDEEEAARQPKIRRRLGRDSKKGEQKERDATHDFPILASDYSVATDGEEEGGRRVGYRARIAQRLRDGNDQTGEPRDLAKREREAAKMDCLSSEASHGRVIFPG